MVFGNLFLKLWCVVLLAISYLVAKILDEPSKLQLTVNDVGFVISEEDLASGPGTSLDHSRAFA